ncbi:branched-chain amino acid aminotransferase [Demequina zhanjiangensis]|uniref:Branched-chain-amino-acid aminotransferase n=1 Tax=Demequina zhanjiangensis TaxID=3051659 RepID=A0ABT8G2J2_9MICO|nr:branched-chain amino acid aminotransferase [Demequina sp. SYSU T00b26]MDN4473355.1 branched-chain amino acid aminotransferase [Demequina sp. SYSU T00b26]
MTTSSSATDASTAEAFRVVANPNPATEAERAEKLSSLKFGVNFTDHMARMTWSMDEGWTDRRIEPYAPLQLDPASSVLHYASEIFEGLKAYKWADGTIRTFRPQANAERFQRSAWRMALPELPTEDFMASIRALVELEKDWVPTIPESSLYLRPFLIGTDVFLGLRQPMTVDYLLIASPSGPYFSGGVKPVSIWVEQEYHRAGPGGTGAAKCGGNYASSLRPQIEAGKRGYDQVLYLDAKTDTVLEELGGMNVFVVMKDGTVVTPVLTGNLLEGVTRASIIQLLEDDHLKVVERDITIKELRDGVASGDVAEVFACGTAAVVTPIGKMGSTDFEQQVGDGQPGPVTLKVRQTLTDIQYGRAEDTYGWMETIC